MQRDGQNNGFNWTAIYDPLGRRLRTVHTPVTAGASGASTTIDSFYDPEVEFEEIGVAVNGARTWKVMGPDIDGSFGGWQGLGGLEATVRESDLQVTPIIQDHFGNVVARIVGGQTLWSSNRVDGYGPLLGYPMPKLSETTTLPEASVWRGKRMDPTGFYYLGARHYEPVSGRFLSPDPAAHEGSYDLYSFANGDPVNFFDPDGRLASGMRQGYASGVQYGTDSGAFSLGYRLGGVLGGLKEGWEGGGQITANNLTFGATDALGLTQSENYQGWEYTGSRYLSTIGRELLITAGTLGTAQAYRATGYGLYGGLATGGEFYSTYQNLSGVAAGFENLQDGNAWGLLQIGGGALGLRGNYAAATQLTGYKLAIDPMRFGTPLGNLKAVPIAAEGLPSTLSPKQINFMQSSIKNQTGEFTVLGNAEALKAGTLKATDLPAIRVWADDAGKVWTLDHRRLASFRVGEVSEVPVQWASPELVQQQMWKMTTKSGGTSVRLKLGDGKSIIVE